MMFIRSLFEEAEEAATEGANKTSGSLLDNLPMLIILGVLVILVIVYFVWSSKKAKTRQAEAQQMLDAIKPGDKVKTIGGVCGIVVSVNSEEETIVIETGEGNFTSYVKFDKQAIYQTNAQIEKEQASKAKEEKPEQEKQEQEKDTDTDKE